MKKIKNPAVAQIFDSYPKHIRQKMLFLRQLVFETASEIDGLGEMEETTKWGEPSYIVKGGSTVRMDWKSKTPSQYALYFHCQTKLVDTFKELYSDKLKFEGNRAIVFTVTDKVPVDEIKHCIALSLTYHSRKKLPMLGV
jgi:hypothetical protein